MPWNPDDPFYIPGIVSPEEWDWRKEGKAIAEHYRKYGSDWSFQRNTRYLGLLRELDRLYEEKYPNIKEGEI